MCMEQFQSPTPAEAVNDIAAKVFTVLDARKGYHQCMMDKQSQLLTTFLWPFGRFKYKWAPYGLSSIVEHYNRQMADTFEGLSRFWRSIDDIIIYDKDEASHMAHVREFLQWCKETDGPQENASQVIFAGLKLSMQEYQVDAAVTDAITKFPTPSTHTDLWAFFVLANQLSTSTDKTAPLLEPLAL